MFVPGSCQVHVWTFPTIWDVVNNWARIFCHVCRIHLVPFTKTPVTMGDHLQKSNFLLGRHHFWFFLSPYLWWGPSAPLLSILLRTPSHRTHSHPPPPPGVSAMAARAVGYLGRPYVGDEAIAMRPVLPVIIRLIVPSVDLWNNNES